MQNKKFLWAIAALFVVAVLGSLFAPDPADDVVIVVSDDGSAELRIPQGSLPEGTSVDTVSVTRMETASARGRLYALEPSGVTFVEPIRFVEIYQAEEADMSIALLESDGEIEVLSESSLTANDAGEIEWSVELTHFSSLLVTPLMSVQVDASDAVVGDSVFVSVLSGSPKQGEGFWISMHEAQGYGSVVPDPDDVLKPQEEVELEFSTDQDGLFGPIAVLEDHFFCETAGKTNMNFYGSIDFTYRLTTKQDEDTGLGEFSKVFSDEEPREGSVVYNLDHEVNCTVPQQGVSDPPPPEPPMTPQLPEPEFTHNPFVETDLDYDGYVVRSDAELRELEEELGGWIKIPVYLHNETAGLEVTQRYIPFPNRQFEIHDAHAAHPIDGCTGTHMHAPTVVDFDGNTYNEPAYQGGGARCGWGWVTPDLRGYLSVKAQHLIDFRNNVGL